MCKAFRLQFFAILLLACPALAALPPGWTQDDIYQSVICGADVDQDEVITTDEMSLCTPQEKSPVGFCDIQAEICSKLFTDVECPPAAVFNLARDKCQADSSGVTCPATYSYDELIDRCIRTPDCPGNGSYSPIGDRCEELIPNMCPVGFGYSKPRGICYRKINCDGEFGNGSYNAYLDRCEMPSEWACPAGYTYSVADGQCESAPYCTTGSVYNPASDRCETSLTSMCPDGYSYDPGADKCLVAATCPSPGLLNKLLDRCEIPASVSCPANTAYNAVAKKCEAAGSCPTNSYLDTATDLCTSGSYTMSCPMFFALSYGPIVCSANLPCKGGINTTSSLGPLTCSVPAQSNGPTCPQGLRLAPNYQGSGANRCYESASTLCAGDPRDNKLTSWSSTDRKCYGYVVPSGAGTVQSPMCGNPYNFAASGLNGQPDCWYYPSCPTGSSVDYTISSCKSYPGQSCDPGLLYYMGVCRGNPLCPIPGSFFNTSLNACTKTASTWCSTGTTSNSYFGGCVSAPPCSPGMYNPSSQQCEVAFLPGATGCPSGYTISADGKTCSAPYSCSGTIDASYNLCYKNILPPNTYYGWTYTLQKFIAWVTCPVDTYYYDGYKSCYYQSTKRCPTGYTQVPGTENCTAPPACSGAGVYNNSMDTCVEQPGATQCAAGYLYSAVYGTCVANPPCQGGSYTPASNQCEAPANLDCPDPSYTINGGRTRCEKLPVCAAGIYSPTFNRCIVDYTGSCPGSTVYDSASGYCVMDATCLNGSLDGYDDVCFQGTNQLCPTGYSLVNDVCRANPICQNSGSLDGTLDLCTVDPSINCPSSGYTYDPGMGICTKPVNCGTDSGALDPSIDFCIATRAQYCDGLTAVINPSVSATACLLTATPPCPVGGAFDSTLGLCVHPQSVCISGYDYDSIFNLCVKYTTDCPNGGRFNPVTRNCEISLNDSCPSGYIPSGQLCVKAVDSCPAGTTFNASKNRCTGDYLNDCPEGATFDLANRRCVYALSCPGDAVFDAISRKCITSTLRQCPVNFTLNAQGTLCTKPMDCTVSAYGSTGSYSGTDMRCHIPIPTCPFQDSVLDVASLRCFRDIYAPGGCKVDSFGTCITALADDCGPGWSYDAPTSACISSTTCEYGSSYNYTTKLCEILPTVTCPSPTSTFDFSTAYCTEPVQCPPGSETIYDTVQNKCVREPIRNCTTGYKVEASSQTCWVAPDCPHTGAYNIQLDLCDGGVLRTCGVVGFFADPPGGVCWLNAYCGVGNLDASMDICASPATIDCGQNSSWIYDPVSTFCVKNAICVPGVYDQLADECQATPVVTCSDGYLFDQDTGVCASPPLCPTDPTTPLSLSIRLSPVLDVCLSNAGVACPGIMEWSGMPVSKCESTPSCPTSYTFNPVSDRCEGASSCPWGDDYACMVNPNDPSPALSCSRGILSTTTHRCEGNAVVVSGSVIDSTYNLTGSGDEKIVSTFYDPPEDIYGDGSSLSFTIVGSTVKIAGKMWSAMRWYAVPNGSTVTWSSDTQAYGTTTIDYKSGLGITVSGAAKIPGALNVVGNGNSLNFLDDNDNYVGSLVFTTTPFSDDPRVSQDTYCSPNPCVDMREPGAAIETTGDETSLKDDGERQDGNCLGEWYIFNGAPSKCYRAGYKSFYTNCCALDPDSILPYIDACGTWSTSTVQARSEKRTHYVGTYCSYSIMGFVCLQRTNVYCAFSTMLARIVHEQGRPQLRNFGPDGDWGSGLAPNCRGFTPEEFSSLDFSKIDLSEYVDTLMGKINSNSQAADAMQNKLDSFFQGR